MSATLATAPSESTTSEQLNPTAARALDWAREWYPSARLTLTGVTDARAFVLIEDGADIRIVRYENLDADVPRCDFCGRPL
jgi:hypothetical protein